MQPQTRPQRGQCGHGKESQYHIMMHCESKGQLTMSTHVCVRNILCDAEILTEAASSKHFLTSKLEVDKSE